MKPEVSERKGSCRWSMDIFKEPKLPVRTVKKFRNPFSGFIGERQNADQVGPLLWTKRNRVVCIVATGALREPRDYSCCLCHTSSYWSEDGKDTWISRGAAPTRSPKMSFV